MASYLRSRLSLLKLAAFPLPKTEIFVHFRPSNDVKFMLHRWVAPSRAFCNIPDGDHSGATKSCVSAMESNSDKIVENADDARSVLSLLNKKRVRDVHVFPSEILGSKERLFELFEAWMIENDRSYPSYKEMMRRFEGFKDSVFKVQKINTTAGFSRICLNKFADHLPSDPYTGALMTEEETRAYPFDLVEMAGFKTQSRY